MMQGTRDVRTEQLRSAGVGVGYHANILEPGCGTGNFMRSVPDGMDVSVTGVEIDPTSASIAKYLARPGDTVINAPLENCSIVEIIRRNG